jgi:hypothetical protein
MPRRSATLSAKAKQDNKRWFWMRNADDGFHHAGKRET